MKVVACVLLSGLPVLALPVLASDIVANGVSAYSICVGPQASPSEVHAAGELQRFLEEMSGARLALNSNCDKAPPQSIVIGEGPATRALGLTVPTGAEEYTLQTAGERLVIAGGRARGTMYGVYAFLDRLGCRWFTVEVSRIPRRTTIPLPSLNENGKPAFEYREPFFTEAWDRDWAARNRTNGDHTRLDASVGGKVQYYPFVHSFNELIPPEKHFATHPEYFSLIGGKRRAERSQLCLTNPDVLKLAISRVEEWIRAHPDATIFSVSQNDWEGWCECERCQRVEREEGGAHSGPLLRFVNAVAAEIGKSHPDKLIDTLAYWYTENPPLRVRPLPNVRIRLCPIGICIAHPMEQCPRSTYFVNNLKAWSQITNQLYIWHYNTNFSHYLAPVPDFDELRTDVAVYKQRGVVGLFMQGAYAPGGGGEGSELRAYVLARLLWDPATDVDREVNDFLSAVYGQAAPAMRRYYDLVHREVRQPPAGLGQHLWIFNLPRFSPSFRAQAEALFREAEDATTDEAVRRRLKKAHLPLEYLDLARAKEYVIQDSSYQPADPSNLNQRWTDFLSRLPSFGITSIHEGRDLKWDETVVAGLRPFKVVMLQNDALRADIVPELGGRTVRLIDKASGLDLLRRPDPGDGGYPAVGGVFVEAGPDYVARSWNAMWSLVSASPAEVVVQADLENGLRLAQRLTLSKAGLTIDARAENRSAAGLQTAFRTTVNFDPGNIGTLGVRFKSVGGEPINQQLIQPGQPPDGNAIFEDAKLPDGTWQIADASGVRASMDFDKEKAGRALASWTAKGVPRATLTVWSKQLTLQPGETAATRAVVGPGGR